MHNFTKYYFLYIRCVFYKFYIIKYNWSCVFIEIGVFRFGYIYKLLNILNIEDICIFNYKCPFHYISFIICGLNGIYILSFNSESITFFSILWNCLNYFGVCIWCFYVMLFFFRCSFRARLRYSDLQFI